MSKDILKNPFIISNKNIEMNKLITSKVIKLSKGFLYYSSDTDITEHRTDDINFILIGYVLDTYNGLSSCNEILEELSGLYLQDYNLFLDKLDCLNGRYVIIANTGIDTEIYNDATALRPIFQWNKSIFASHEILVKEAAKIGWNTELEDFGVNNGYLDYTNTVDVYKFNPNLKFSFKDREYERIYPRHSYEVMNKDEILQKLMMNFDEQIKWLNNTDKKLYFSITGGYDSRVSLSLVKPMLEKITFFTYIADLSRIKDGVRKNIYLKDKDNVEKIGDNLNLNHHIYDLKNYYPDENFKEQLSNSISSNHSLNVSYLMYKEFEENSIHVKSTLYEIAKMPYPEEMDFTLNYNRLFRLSTKWQTVNFKRLVKDKKAYFNNFIERTKFKEIERFNYNLPLLLFWESRMANWHGNITQETEHTSETFIFLNNRYVLDLLMRADFDVRKNKELLEDIVHYKWPIIQYFVPNTYRTLKEQAENKNNLELQNLSLRLTSISNLDMKLENNKIIFKPSEDTYLFDDRVGLQIKNTGNKNKYLKIKGGYKHPVKNIFIKINDVRYSINEVTDGIDINLSPEDDLTVEYHYTRNFKNKSWFDAGRITVECME